MCGPLDLKLLWQDSLRRGLFSRELAKRLKLKDAEEVFTAALLQDMAIPLLAKELPEEYAELFENRAEGRVRLSDLEQEQFGWTHGEAAAIMASGWSLPNSFTRLLTSHNRIDDWRTTVKSDPALFAIGLSALLPTGVDSGWADLEQAVELFEQESGLDANVLRELIDTVDELFEEFAPVLQLQGDTPTLASKWAEETERVVSP